MVQAPGVRQWGPCSGVGEAGRPGGQCRSVMTPAAVGVGGLVLWRGHPARRCPALCVHWAAAHPSSKCIFHLPLRLSVLRTRETGWRGGGRRCRTYPPVSRSQWRTSVNDSHPWKLYMPPGMSCAGGMSCAWGDVMYVCHSIRRNRAAERTAVDIKAHTPLIRFIVDLLLVCCTWPSFCTKWQAQTIWVTRCSPVVLQQWG